MSRRTISKHAERVSALFNWAINQGYTNRNVFRGKLEPLRKTKTVEKHFTDQEMDLILGEKLTADSIAVNKPERYWATLVSAYSGARLNEVCQLNGSDIQLTDGIWAINLNADCDDKSIKTEAGNRIIPLHPKLLDLGLLGVCEANPESEPRKTIPQPEENEKHRLWNND